MTAFVYFIGIGGIGMSALARYYKHAGAQVAGYDRTPSPLTAELEREGVDIHYSDDVALIPPAFTASPDNTLVIYTPAVPAEHSELSYFTNNNYTLIKRSKALGHIAATKTTLAVAGTHGKTTITTMLAHLLTQAAGGCTAFLGGISKNYHSNLLLSDKPALVAEADEFDRSFLQLFPQIAVITATDADHLDIYGTAGEVKKAFADFARQVKPGGALIIKEGVELSLAGGGTGTAGVDCPPPACGHPLQEGDNPFPVPRSPFTVYRYSANRPCDFYADNIRLMDNGLPQFDLHLLGTVLPDCVLGIPGRMNVENAVAATAAAYLYFVHKPSGDVDKPLGDVDKPLGDVDKPLGDVDKPLGDVDKPSGDVDKPSGDVDKPSGDVDKPSGDVDKPLGDVDKPLGDVDKPLGDVNQNHSVLSALRSALAAFSGVQRRF
ncbi:MAG: Mur ligase domain-containing protein, partial [Prevotellaceae bacterium]|nr:Mur ligase domain-containing protein [Prevotellaceae bacterium]